MNLGCIIQLLGDGMEPVTVSVFILLLGTLQQVQRLGNMLIPAKRGMGEIMATVVGVIAILVLTYLYGQTPVHYGQVY